MSRRIVVEFLGKDKSLGSTAADADRKTSRLGTTLAKVGKMAAVGLGVGAVVAGKALVGMTKNAMEDEAAQRKLAVAMKNSVNATDAQIAAVEDYITKQGLATGVTDDEMRPAFQRLVQATGSVKEAQRQMSIAMDVSAGTGKSLKTVSEALMKANNGTTASLSKLGLKTKDANGETLSLDDAMKAMSETFGGQAAAKAGTLEGKMDRLKLIFDETKETIGAKLIPVAERFADWVLTDGIPLAKDFGETMQDLGSKVADVTRFIKRHKTALTALGAVIAAIIVVTKIHSVVMAAQAAGGLAKLILGIPVVTKLTKAWAAAQWLINAAMAANPLVLVTVLLAALVVGVVVAYKKSETFRRIVDGAFRAIGGAGKWMWEKALKPAFEAFKTALTLVGKAGIWLWNNALQPAFRFIVGGIGKLIDMWAGMLRGLAKVPGFGWARGAADAMQRAADKATGLANSIDKIPSSKTVNVNVNTWRRTYSKVPGLGWVDGIGNNARGTSFWKGGATWVGEEGPEIVDLPRGSRVTPHRQSMARAGAGGGSVVEVHFNGLVTDPRAVGRELVRALREYERSSGRSLGVTF